MGQRQSLHCLKVEPVTLPGGLNGRWKGKRRVKGALKALGVRNGVNETVTKSRGEAAAAVRRGRGTQLRTW